jgi:hypothetical protein
VPVEERVSVGDEPTFAVARDKLDLFDAETHERVS